MEVLKLTTTPRTTPPADVISPKNPAFTQLPGRTDPRARARRRTGARRRAPHQPKVVTITQSTELGMLYQPHEIAALAETAHELDMYLHLDGARISNAAAALGWGFAGVTTHVGVDVVSFGGPRTGS